MRLTWYDAVNYTRWRSARERACYRLPTEAEWEYATRAGTTTPFNTGHTYPAAYWKNQVNSWYPDRTRNLTGEPANLTVAQFPPNAFGLHDTHGNVEEWTASWYAPYGGGGDGDGDGFGGEPELFRVTRGGSHSTEVYYLRSANRAGALPEDSSWYIGFRVVLDKSASWEACELVFEPTDVSIFLKRLRFAPTCHVARQNPAARQRCWDLGTPETTLRWSI